MSKAKDMKRHGYDGIITGNSSHTTVDCVVTYNAIAVSLSDLIIGFEPLQS